MSTDAAAADRTASTPPEGVENTHDLAGPWLEIIAPFSVAMPSASDLDRPGWRLEKPRGEERSRGPR